MSVFSFKLVIRLKELYCFPYLAGPWGRTFIKKWVLCDKIMILLFFLKISFSYIFLISNIIMYCIVSSLLLTGSSMTTMMGSVGFFLISASSEYKKYRIATVFFSPVLRSVIFRSTPFRPITLYWPDWSNALSLASFKAKEEYLFEAKAALIIFAIALSSFVSS